MNKELAPGPNPMTSPSTARNELTRHAAAPDLIGRARVTTPSRENALRLLAAYERVYCSDDELYRRATNPAPDQGIDGLTEPMTVEEFQRLLALPDSVTVEIPRPDEPLSPPLAFTVLQYATAEERSAERFAAEFLQDDFALENLRFVEDDDRALLMEAVRRGRGVYLKEIVSGESSTATLALLTACYVGVIEPLLGPGGVTIYGKCLDAAAVDGVRNDWGNRPVKRLACSMGLRQVAHGIKLRPLQLSASAAPPPQCSPSIAQLEFGLYLGGDKHVVRMIAPWRSYVNDLA